MAVYVPFARAVLVTLFLTAAFLFLAWLHGPSSWGVVAAWALAVAVFGWAGLFVCALTRRPNPRVTCPSCGRKRPMAGGTCHRCGAPFPPPERDGTEILEGGAA